MPCPMLPEFFQEEILPVAGCSLIHKKSLPVSPYTDEELVDYMDKAGDVYKRQPFAPVPAFSPFPCIPYPCFHGMFLSSPPLST